jgi:ABC-type transport system substrate-binding protein
MAGRPRASACEDAAPVRTFLVADAISGNNGNQDYYDYINLRRHHAPAGPGGWLADYPAPSNFIDVLLSCSADMAKDNPNPGEFCDPVVDAQIKSALTLQTTDPAAAGTAWAAIDHLVTDLAPWVPLANDTGWDLVSARVGNYSATRSSARCSTSSGCSSGEVLNRSGR